MKREQKWRSRCLGGLAALALLTHCGGGDEPQGQAPEEPRPQVPASTEQELATTLTFTPTADARVEAAAPTQNFGGASTLGADLSPQMESYLRFSLSGVTGPVSAAKLRLYAVDGSSDGPRVYRTAGGWTEAGLTWNTRPALSGSALDDEGAISTGTWVEYDVTSAVSGHGELNLALIPTSSNGTDFSSREASTASLQPQLVVTFEPAGCMPRRERYFFNSISYEDSHVSQGSPTTNFGWSTGLLVDGSPRMETYIRFDVYSYGFEVVDARMRLYAFNATADGPLLYRTGNSWGELGITWDTRPALIGGPLGNLGAISTQSWATYNVTGAVTGPDTYTFALIPESSDGVDFYSSESDDSALYPQLSLIEQTPPYCSYRGTGGGRTAGARQFGGAGQEQLEAMATDAEGGFVTAGRFGDVIYPENEGFALARYSAEGIPLWTRVVATDDVYVRALTVTPLGNILVVGNYEGSPDLGTGPLPPQPDGWDDPPGLFIAKYSPSGALQWLRSFAPTGQGIGNHRAVFPGEVTTDAEGSVIITGGFFGTLDLGGGPLVQTQEGTAGFIAKFSWSGAHLWSRAFQTDSPYAMAIVNTSTTNAAGQLTVGGVASAGSDLGNGPLGVSGPFIARYSPSGSLLWARVFSGVGLGSEVASVRTVDAETVAFTANLGGTFTFGGRTYTGGDPTDPNLPTSGFIGTLGASGTDGWLRAQNRVTVAQLAVGPGGTLTTRGYASGEFDLGGGALGLDVLPDWPTFVVRYSGSGSHLWSRTFDPDLSLRELGLQPDGSVLLGGTSHEEAELDGRIFTPNGESDLFFLKLTP